jgi:hypothetical protein
MRYLNHPFHDDGVQVARHHLCFLRALAWQWGAWYGSVAPGVGEPEIHCFNCSLF